MRGRWRGPKAWDRAGPGMTTLPCFTPTTGSSPRGAPSQVAAGGHIAISEMLPAAKHKRPCRRE